MQNQKTVIQNKGRQAGVTLMELIASLAVMAVVVVGALALYNSAQSSQQATSITQDVSSIRASVKQLWAGQGTYGASGTNLNGVLINAKRIPSTMTVTAGTTVTTVLNGSMVASAAPTAGQYRITLTNVPEDTCIALATGTNGWLTLGAGAAGTTMITLPATPVTADTACVETNIMVFTGV